MKRQEYRESYLESDHWKETRARARHFHGNKCLICGAKTFLDVHHIHYDNINNEDIGRDLAVLCRYHHTDYHETFGSASRKKFEKFCKYWGMAYSRSPKAKKLKKKNRVNYPQIAYRYKLRKIRRIDRFHNLSKEEQLRINLKYIEENK